MSAVTGVGRLPRRILPSFKQAIKGKFHSNFFHKFLYALILILTFIIYNLNSLVFNVFMLL